MNCGRLTAIFLGLLVLTGVAQTPQGQRYVVLSSNSESKFPPRLAWDQGSYGSWKPSSEDIQSVEISLYRISEMNIAGWPPQVRIEHPERYFRQYVGVSNRGERRIYINAFCDDPPPSDWRKRLHVVIDGATCYWQALYDPATKTFSNLTINARA
jgi:hypothetical protein